jgi:predicted O-methyltransferase YrrM
LFYQVITYLKWLPKTFYLNGIHSPFVFTFRKECLKNKKELPTYNTLKTYRKKVLQNQTSITVTDFGAGSRVFTSNQRRIKEIARYAGATQKRMQLLHRITKYLNPKNVLEIGTSLGMGTVALSTESTAKITSLEGCPETAEAATKQLHSFNITNAHIKIGEFDKNIKKLASQNFDLIYFDGNHSKNATLAYTQSLLATATNDTLWIFDDIHWSPEMTEAWEHIKELPEVTATIDCFWLGFVFFRKEQKKEHFYSTI